MILTVTLNPSVDHALFVETLKPYDTNRVIRTETDAGGKGVNLARVAAELGAHTIATGFLGGGNGAFVRKVLDRQHVQHDFIEIEGDTRTNISVEDNTEKPPTTFNEPGPQISPEALEQLVQKCRQLAPTAKWVALGGSLPPGVPKDIFKTLATLFREQGKKVALDADGEPMQLGVQAGINLIKPNAKEAERLVKRPVQTLPDAVTAARELQKHARIAVISRGEDGAVMACDDGLYNGISPAIHARSTIGSGDSLVAGMLWALLEGQSLEDAFRWGIAAGAATATTDGSEIARKPTILDLLPRVQIERL